MLGGYCLYVNKLNFPLNPIFSWGYTAKPSFEQSRKNGVSQLNEAGCGNTLFLFGLGAQVTPLQYKDGK